MNKSIYSLFAACIICLSSCDYLQDELGIDLGQNKDNEEQEENNPPVNVNVRKTPCAYFTFDGNYKDLSGNDNYAYGNPEPTFVAGPRANSKALSFSRANGSLVVVNDGLIDTPSMTVSFWIKDIDEGDIFWVTSSNNWNGKTRMMHLSFVNGHLRYVMDRYHANYWSFDKLGHFTHQTIDDGEWHHITLVSDFNVKKQNTVTTILYVDGILMDTINEEYSDWNEGKDESRHFGTGTKFLIGGTNTPNMKLCNLRVYDEWQLPAEEVKKLYDNGL